MDRSTPLQRVPGAITGLMEGRLCEAPAALTGAASAVRWGWMSHQGSRKVPGFRLYAMISVKCRPEKRTLPWQSDPPLFSDRSSGRAAAAMGSAGVVHRPVVPVQCIEMYRSSQGDYVKVYSDHHNW